ncbi:hypothetical protein Ccrd_003071 [Cynara cardunculus var. scolymus]|uniref:Uncharacterized protein n=1 Tax=Cynara cardunculus var. scolymus TaxID=59895 RepID=A0A118JW01_CYNCS|nr:hypothetical protein Ccrd_003071 [Cynara cardunculus var. scolymus]
MYNSIKHKGTIQVLATITVPPSSFPSQPSLALQRKPASHNPRLYSRSSCSMVTIQEINNARLYSRSSCSSRSSQRFHTPIHSLSTDSIQGDSFLYSINRSFVLKQCFRFGLILQESVFYLRLSICFFVAIRDVDVALQAVFCFSSDIINSTCCYCQKDHLTNIYTSF